MNLNMKFEESNQRINIPFSEVHQASDGGFERGYEQGYTEGNENGYKEGYFEGQEESASLFGIQNEVTGHGIVTCDYVNENEHNVEVKLSSDTITDFSGCEVKCISKNFYSGGDVSGLQQTTIRLNEKIPSGTYVFSAIITSSDTNGTMNNVSFRDDNMKEIANFNLPRNNRASASFTIPVDTDTVVFYAGTNSGSSVGDEFSFTDIQIEKEVATDYEPYTEKTYTANADGTLNVTSISPTMNIICDGVDISAKYYCMQDVEWHRFWDEYQDYGQRVNYEYAFRGVGWTDKTLKPKYKITPTYATGMCSNALITKVSTDIFDFSKTTTLYNAFEMASNLTEVVANDLSLVTNANNLFYYSSKIQKINLGGINPSCSFSNAFYLCISLVDFECSGSFGKSVSFQWSTLLSVESAKNIILHLVNYLGTNMDMANTISFHANVWTLLDAEGNTSPNGNTWREYVDDLGWRAI